MGAPTMSLIAVHAHFDGERIHLDEPYQLEPETQLLIIVLPKGFRPAEQNDWPSLAQNALENAYGQDEPEYSVTLTTYRQMHTR
jgi:hypothetical protein